MDENFCIYYDETLSHSTPYSFQNTYVRRAASRVENTIALLPKLNRCKILDLGASPFYFLYRCKKLGADRATGIFFSNDAHPLADRNVVYTEHGDIEILHSDLLSEKLPFDDNTFDIVAAMEIFEHFPIYPRLLLAEVTRVTKPDGFFFITVPNIHRLANITKLLLKRNVFMPYRSDPSGRHAHEYTKKQVMALFEEGLASDHATVKPVFNKNKPLQSFVRGAVANTPLIDWLAPVWFGSASLANTLAQTEVGLPKNLYDDAESTERSI